MFSNNNRTGSAARNKILEHFLHLDEDISWVSMQNTPIMEAMKQACSESHILFELHFLSKHPNFSVRQRYQQRQWSRGWCLCKHPTRAGTREAPAAGHSWAEGRAKEVWAALASTVGQAKSEAKLEGAGRRKEFCLSCPQPTLSTVRACSVQNWMITVILVAFFHVSTKSAPSGF